MVKPIKGGTPENYMNKSVFTWKGSPYNIFCLGYFMVKAKRKAKLLEHTL